MRLPLVIVLTVLGTSLAKAQESTPQNQGPLIVQVGVMSVRPDGTVGGYAVSTGEKENADFGGGIVTDGCRFGAGDNWVGAAIPAWGMDAWEIRGKVIKLAPDQATVQLDWRRVRTAGRPVEETAHSTQLTLPAGQLSTLDTAGTNSACVSQLSVFGARYAPKYPPGMSNGPTAGSGVGGGARVNLPAYDAEMWLVRTVPGQPDGVLPLAVRITGGSGSFDFAPVRIPVPEGSLNVHVSGNLRVLGNTPQPTLAFSATRSTTFLPSNRPPRDSGEVDHGQAAVSKRLPGPDEVIEFEMPPLQLRGLPAVPDAFAVRLRIRLAK